MTDRLLAELEVFSPEFCQIFEHANKEWTATAVSKNATGVADGSVVEEFTLVGDRPNTLPETADRADTQEVFSTENRHIYRLSRPESQGCVCDRIERADCVVHNVRANADSLVVTFLIPDVETLRTIVSEIRDNAACVKLRRLVEDDSDIGETRPVVFEQGALTSRQREVIEHAHDRGYFEHPRESTAGEVAEGLGITTSTFTEHLAAAQRKLLDELLATG